MSLAPLYKEQRSPLAIASISISVILLATFGQDEAPAPERLLFRINCGSSTGPDSENKSHNRTSLSLLIELTDLSFDEEMGVRVRREESPPAIGVVAEEYGA